MKLMIEAISPGGFRVQLELEGELESMVTRLPDVELFLEEAGFSPSVEPPRTPDGLPICRRHGAVMKRREKQGDAWFSHLVTANGQELWCKGRPGADSPGWEV